MVRAFAIRRNGVWSAARRPQIALTELLLTVGDVNLDGSFRWLAEPTVRGPARLLCVPGRFRLEALIVQLFELSRAGHVLLVDDVVFVRRDLARLDTEFLALLIVVDTNGSDTPFSRIGEVLVHLFG